MEASTTVRRRHRRAMVAGLLLLVLAAACGGSPPPASTPAGGDQTAAPPAADGGDAPAVAEPDATATAAPGGGELTRLRVGDLRIGSQTTNYAADQLGIFSEHGLAVEFTYATSGQEIISALESDTLDIGLSIPGVVIVANAQGFDFVGIAQNETARAEGPDSGGLLVRTDSDIQSLADLEGRSIGVLARGANQVYVAVVQALLNAGVDPESVTFQEVPFPQMGDVLAQGQVDAVSAVDPFTTFISSSGEGRVISWYYIDALPEMPIGAFWAKRSWAEANRETVDAYRSALAEAAEYLKANPDEARDLMSEFTEIDRAILDEMPLINWSTDIDLSVWEELIQMYVDQGQIEEGAVTVETLLSEEALAGASR